VWETPNAPRQERTDGTAAQLSAARHVWEEDVQTYRTCTSIQQALKNQIIGVFEPMYLEILNDNMVGYATISARDMLDHLFETYGNITAVDLEINFEHMRRAWDPQQPMETLFKQIQECADYSEAGGVLVGHSQQIPVASCTSSLSGLVFFRLEGFTCPLMCLPIFLNDLAITRLFSRLLISFSIISSRSSARAPFPSARCG
jgi:hypothetical protein